ncbi:MAG: hypothetical protein Q4D29_08605 [Lachnospiraceae bacterium]|nr:hypothetical protein [Lachnospiraceae bacterium]
MAALYTSNSKPDSLKADAYILYMIMGSYFNTCKCDNAILEKRLFLNYKDLSLNKQYAREEKIIAKVEKLDEDFLNKFEEIDAMTRITFEGDEAEVLFYADNKVLLKAKIDRKGTITFLA